ncbi:MAG: hypothetical protein L0229_22755 [Blastocatellia bacterium]|nr:hypothetical protein [Blastocatellia bacterium]
MNESHTITPADTLISLIKASLTADGIQGFDHLVVYTSFGAVRGRIGLAFAQGLASGKGNPSGEAAAPREVIELNDVTIEHYSNHLPTASFDRFYVRLTDVHGFALVGLPGQG